MVLGDTFSLIPTVSLSIVNIYAIICILKKRSHDLNKSGLFVALSFIPIVNLYPAILFIFIRGTKGENKYGSDPLENV